MSSNSPIMEVKNICKDFVAGRKIRRVIESMSLDVSDGDFVALVGPSGCGKTTALRIMAGIIPSTKGEIKIRGKDLKESQRDTGFVFQSPTLLPWRTILQNTMLPLEVLGLKEDKWQQRARELLDKVGLSRVIDAYPGQLSGGMQQRVGITRALVHNPSILFMDEPFGALDAITRETLNFEIMDIWREFNKTIIFVTHSINEAVLLSNRVIIMGTNPGRIVKEVVIDLPRPRTKEHLSSERFNDLVREIHETIDKIMIESESVID